ncbi:F-box/kelch-repeat protein, partial [Thalictrum thalictroides]
MEVLNDPSERRRKRQALWSKLFSELEEFVVTTKEFRPWSSLPIKYPKIMEFILSHLYYSDHARVRAVCKTWSSMHRVAPMKQLPWLILWGKDSCRSFKLIDPQYSIIYTIEMENTVFEGKDLSEIEICACKHSWFLMSSSTDQHVYSFVLYSPFMNSLERVIELPILNSNRKIQIATFSSNPTSPDCVFFTLSYDYTKVDISTCSRGDTAWTIGTFHNNVSMDELWGLNYSVGPHINVAYLDGKFYWTSFYPEMVGTYSIVEKDYHL